MVSLYRHWDKDNNLLYIGITNSKNHKLNFYLCLTGFVPDYIKILGLNLILFFGGGQDGKNTVKHIIIGIPDLLDLSSVTSPLENLFSAKADINNNMVQYMQGVNLIERGQLMTKDYSAAPF